MDKVLLACAKDFVGERRVLRGVLWRHLVECCTRRSCVQTPETMDAMVDAAAAGFLEWLEGRSDG